MSQNFTNFNEKFKVSDLLVTETDYWRWSVRPLQCTLGAGILSLKRPAESMAELSLDEGADLVKITKIIEGTLSKAFNKEKMNYIMLMMVDFHIHFHVIPRYSTTKQFDEKDYVDQGWPKPPVLDATPLDIEVLIKIKDFMRSFIK
jgi:diadenosine tetraphosphate (Ap4A) HIT family hydrolase